MGDGWVDRRMDDYADGWMGGWTRGCTNESLDTH